MMAPILVEVLNLGTIFIPAADTAPLDAALVNARTEQKFAAVVGELEADSLLTAYAATLYEGAEHYPDVTHWPESGNGVIRARLEAVTPPALHGAALAAARFEGSRNAHVLAVASLLERTPSEATLTTLTALMQLEHVDPNSSQRLHRDVQCSLVAGLGAVDRDTVSAASRLFTCADGWVETVAAAVVDALDPLAASDVLVNAAKWHSGESTRFIAIASKLAGIGAALDRERRAAWEACILERMDARDLPLTIVCAEQLGAVGSMRAARSLVDVLRADDERAIVLSPIACRSLARIARQPLPASREAWEAWLDAEEAWMDRRGIDLAVDLVQPHAPTVLAALRELVNHPAYAPEFQAELERTFRHESWRVRSGACLAHANLGRSVPEETLQVLLTDESEEVRSAARRLEGMGTSDE